MYAQTLPLILIKMKNKALLIAGIGSAIAISAASALSFVSANETTAVTATTQTQGKHGSFVKGAMKKGMEMMDRGMGKMEMGMEMGRFGKMTTAMQTAVKNNDYNAFVTAWNADTNKPSKAVVPTADQFAKMVKQEQKRTAVEAAITNNDYNAYVTATTPTQEEFTQRVTQTKSRQALDAAITANDYNAFVTAWNANTNKPTDATVPTAEQFAKMVARQIQTK